MKPGILFLSMVMFAGITIAQTEGDVWTLGYWGPSGTDQSAMFIDFRSNIPKIIKHTELKILIAETVSNICDQDGEPLLWTNGMQIMGKSGVSIADTIAYDYPDGYWDYFYNDLNPYKIPFGFPKHDGAIILPVPGFGNEYSVIYHFADDHPELIFAATQFLESRIGWSADTGFVLRYKDVPIGPRIEWYTGTISAIRHANGRDWWIVSFEEDSPNYFSHLLDPSGIHLHHQGGVDSIVREGLGQAVFSSQGNYFARMDAVSQNEGEFITLYSFDRCAGDFERMVTFNVSSGLFTGVAFSPSERFLYADNNKYLWQWDLWAADIPSSQTLVDSFDGFIQPGWFAMRFGPLVNAPDGRIYIVPSAGSSKYLHVIDRPDLHAAECRFLQHHINLEIWNSRTAPNIPNYRLGPDDGSPCDTLGLNNHPVARWRYEEDTIGIAERIRFTDLSYFDPHTWHWDFGDGNTSEEPSPIHEYAHGLYHACLTVSNEYDTDSSCQWIEILPTSIKEERKKNLADISVFPNPFNEHIEINTHDGIFRSVHVQIFDMHGRILLNQPGVIPSKMILHGYPPGVYLVRLREEDGRISNFKVMKN